MQDVDTRTHAHTVEGAQPFAEWARDEYAQDAKKAERHEKEARRIALLATVVIHHEQGARVSWSSPVVILGGEPVVNYYDGATGPHGDFERYIYSQHGDGNGGQLERPFSQMSKWRFAYGVQGKRAGGSIGTVRARILRRASVLALQWALEKDGPLLLARAEGVQALAELKRADDQLKEAVDHQQAAWERLQRAKAALAELEETEQ